MARVSGTARKRSLEDDVKGSAGMTTTMGGLANSLGKKRGGMMGY